MKCVKMAAWVALAGLTLMIPLSSVTGDAQQGKSLRPVVESQQQQLPAAVDMPVYQPPPRGAPGGRVGGSSRGLEDRLPVLSVLAPDHTGLTVQEQPFLYWYLSKSTTYPVELTIIDDQSIQPLIERRISGPIQPGVQRVRLADYGMRLSPGVPYRWSVALVVDPDNRSRDILAGGFIERIALPEALRTQLAGAGKARVPFIYAEAGLWYDSLAAISELIDAAPNDPLLRKQRASLLEQVQLAEVAQYDTRPHSAK
jgi:Domain of Unknown Function (DUF928)